MSLPGPIVPWLLRDGGEPDGAVQPLVPPRDRCNSSDARPRRPAHRRRNDVGDAATSTVPAALAAYVKADRSADQWALRSTHAAAAWTKSTGVGVTVAIIDTGVDESNPDLQGQLVTGAHIDKTGALVVGDLTDTYGHGTHVAGIIAATPMGTGSPGSPGGEDHADQRGLPAPGWSHRRHRDPLGSRPRRRCREPVSRLRRHQAVPVRHRTDLRGLEVRPRPRCRRRRLGWQRR